MAPGSGIPPAFVFSETGTVRFPTRRDSRDPAFRKPSGFSGFAGHGRLIPGGARRGSSRRRLSA